MKLIVITLFFWIPLALIGQVKESDEYNLIQHQDSKTGKYGYKNLVSSELEIPCKFEEAYEYHQYGTKWFAGVKWNGKYGMIDNKGNWVIPAKFDDSFFLEFNVSPFAVTRANDRYGLLNFELREVLPCRYDIRPEPIPNSSFWAIRANDRWGIADTSGKIVLPCYFDKPIRNFDANGLAIVTRNGMLGVWSNSGKEIIPSQYEKIELKQYPLLTVWKNKKMGLFDGMNQKLLVPCFYDDIILDNNHKIVVQKEKKYGLFDTSIQKEVIPCKYNSFKELREKEKW
ncbi:MAG: WG repeat-containing protein [Bacteroidia bacterium]|nr:WG repeat-containing protein [Bacteroidia bacterium]